MTEHGDGLQGQLFRIGGPVGETVARLRVLGDELIPERVTQMLRCEPTEALKRGDLDQTRSRRQRVHASTGLWLLVSPLSPTEPLEAHIETLLSHVTSDLEVWAGLKESFDVEIDVGLFLTDDNQDIGLSPRVFRALAERGIGLDVDIYALGDSDDSDPET